MTHFADKEYKVLRTTYLLLITGVLAYFIIALFQKKEVLLFDNINISDFRILISLSISLAILYIGNTYFNKKLINLKNYKGLMRKKIQFYIDATIMRLFSIEFAVILNILFFKQTNNLIFAILAFIFIFYIFYKMPKRTNFNAFFNKK